MDLKTILTKPGSHIHFIGIGGVSMIQLAEVLFDRGLKVTGSDMQDSQRLRDIEALGVAVSTSHDGSLMDGAAAVVRSAAIHDDNAEVLLARERGILLVERADLLGLLTSFYEYSVCVAGTHGKTTTTSMLTHIATVADRAPTAFIGARTPAQPKGFVIGSSNIMITESCEYYNSFLKFYPKIALILNIEHDHPDFFATLEQLVDTFRTFALRTPSDGLILIKGDCQNSRKAVEGLPFRTYGLEDSDDVQARGLEWHKGFAEFDVVIDGQFYSHIKLSVPGEYNMLNALAAAGVAKTLGIAGSDVADALASFRSAERRMTYKGTVNGVDVYDDYAHHPTAVRMTIEAVHSMGYNNVHLVFQPHTYSRTAALFDDFVAALSGAEHIILPDIYAAREKNEVGMTSQKIAEQLPNARAMSGFDDIAATLLRDAQPGDLILTMGAGDVWKIGDIIVAKAVDSDAV